ncbi:hypothetical protein A2T55_14600 [Brevibacterium linens]|uniref:Uncharacterized protein n=1 Tax=Brevibacterium linens TaxID=1703 RepID=A0A142NPS6_BRELN|nr:hypothetical protein A2T55_14600 [Brevibacterium linens]
MPDRPTGAEDPDRDRASVGGDRDSVDPSVSGSGGETGEPSHGDGDTETDESRRARIEAAKRRYRATLRNEADSGGGGFSEDYYRSQKPPHWS